MLLLDYLKVCASLKLKPNGKGFGSISDIFRGANGAEEEAYDHSIKPEVQSTTDHKTLFPFFMHFFNTLC